MKKVNFLQIMVLVIMNFVPAAFAAPLRVDFTGHIDSISPAYNGSISLTDTIIGTIHYDDGILSTPGVTSVPLDTSDQFTLDVRIGPYVLNKTFDADYGHGFPRVDYSAIGKEFLGLDFFVTDFETADNALEILHNELGISAINADDFIVTGTISYTVVPLPAAFWLFFAGGSILRFMSKNKPKNQTNKIFASV